MSSEFTKENIDQYLKEVAKEYRKRIGKSMPAEIILIGGASVLINYGFRGMTTDIDAIIQAASGMRDAIGAVGDKYGLPFGWLNTDFEQTDSYTPKLLEFSDYYRTYSNVLSIRTVRGEYLIAMKLRSGRQYKNDLSDVVGILREHKNNGTPIDMVEIRKAVSDLYGDWEQLPEISRSFIENVMQSKDLDALFAEIVANEKETKGLLMYFQKDYPGVLKGSNAEKIIADLKTRKTESRQKHDDRER